MNPQPFCPLCASDSIEARYPQNPASAPTRPQHNYKITDHTPDLSLRVLSCRKCGLAFLHPFPDPEQVNKSYQSMEDSKYLQEEAGRRGSARFVIAALNKIKKGKGRLLDVGCATGFLLDEARKDGWEVHGVELSHWAVRHARECLSLENIHLGDLSTAPFQTNQFDAIVMTDVIEHLPDPRATIQHLRTLLKPQGVLCCNTPDISSLMSRLLGAKWWGIKHFHLYYFNKSTLRELFSACGLTIFKTRSHPRIFTLGYWVENMSLYKPSLAFLDRFFKKHPRWAALTLKVNLGDQIEVFARKSRQIQYLDELERPPVSNGPSAKPRIIAVLPAYRAARTLEKTVTDIPKGCVDDILLVDDASDDATVETARRLGLTVFVHERNKGYGANQKTCYQKALSRGADIVVMVHPDYQYDPKAIPSLIEPIMNGRADAVFGSRMMKGGALEGGMPVWKYNANILLTALENVVLGIYLTEYHSGFRAYSRQYLTRVNFEANSDGFVFDTEIIVQGALKFLQIEEVPIRTRYFDESSSISLWPSILYGLQILKTLVKFLFHKQGWRFKQFE